MTQITKEQAQAAFQNLTGAAALAPLNRATHDAVSAAANTLMEILQSVYEPELIAAKARLAAIPKPSNVIDLPSEGK